MKKSILMLAMMITVASSAVLANDDKDVNAKVLSTFNKEFQAAKDVKWGQSGDFIKATFVMNAHRVVAIFDDNGALLGTARDILFSELPLNVAIAINKEYKDAGIYGVYEVSNGEGINYHMTIDTGKCRLQAKVTPFGGISVLKKAKK